MNSLLSSTVPDPSDFPTITIAPGLRTLDSALRCTICGELFDAPVTLPCGHCFCSFCVRTAMVEKQECPACRKTANDGHIRPNPAMEEAIAAWKSARSYVLKLSKEDEQRVNSLCSDSPTRKKRKITINLEKPKSSGNCDTPSKKKRARKSPDSDMEATVPTSDADEDEIPMLNADPKPDDLINCPMCNKRVKYRSINQHLDKGCQDRPESTRSDWNKIMGGSKKGKQKDNSDLEDTFPLPKASYATLKDKQLKDMLLEHSLPATGDRNLWIQRHQRWVMIYNANLDRSSALRKTTLELRRELKRWEDEKSKKRKHTVEDSVSYQKRHKDEFAKLVDAARGKPPTSKPSPANSDSHGPAKTLSLPQEDAIVVDSEEERASSRYFS